MKSHLRQDGTTPRNFRRRTSGGWRWWLTALCALALQGCIISPQPEPPSVDTERISITLTSEEPGDPDPDTVNFVGAPGAASPGGGRLSIVNLQDGSAHADVAVELDGRFEVSLPGVPGDRFRLQVIATGRYSPPVQVVTPDRDGPVEREEPALGGCLQLDPGDVVDLGEVELGSVGAALVTVNNECSSEVFLFDAWLALDFDGFDECEVAYAECLDGEDPITEVCALDWELCGEGCNTDYADCIDLGTPPDECLDMIIDCERACVDDEWACIYEMCEMEHETCWDPVEPDRGFALSVAAHDGIPPGSSRTMVVTYAPFDMGYSEQLLVVAIGEPDEAYLTLLITGTGVL